jgi:mRNA-degrading endonuclease toxin of MazEF toxin-antitoxin module
LYRFPLPTNLLLKKRPAVVISSETYNTERPDLIIMAVTSQIASHELRAMQKHVEENREIFLEAWNEYIGG